MDWITLIVSIVGALIGGGGIMSIANWKQQKRAAKIENDSKVISDSNTLMEKYKDLADERQEALTQMLEDRQRTVDNFRQEREAREARIDELQNSIIALKNQILKLSTDNARLRVYKCTRVACDKRKPPFMMEELHVEDSIEDIDSEQKDGE